MMGPLFQGNARLFFLSCQAWGPFLSCLRELIGEGFELGWGLVCKTGPIKAGLWRSTPPKLRGRASFLGRRIIRASLPKAPLGLHLRDYSLPCTFESGSPAREPIVDTRLPTCYKSQLGRITAPTCVVPLRSRSC